MILLTGFFPLQNQKRDTSGEIADILNGTIFKGKEIRGIILKQAKNEIDNFYENELKGRQNVIISMCVEAGIPSIILNRMAINKQVSEDPNSEHPEEKEILTDFSEGLFSNLPLGEMVHSLRSARIPSKLMYVPDTSIYNRIYFLSLAASGGKSVQVKFPASPEMTVTGEIPVLDVESMIKAIEIVIQKIV